MRLGLLGTDEQILSLARAAVSGGHEIVLGAELGSRQREVQEIARSIRIADDWSDLLDSAAVDGVLVAADATAVRVEQLRRLVQLGIPVLAAHPVSLSMLDCYELDMIRRESGSVLLACLPARRHPAVANLRAIFAGADSEIGAVEQVSFERPLAERHRDNVLQHFARDADLIQAIAGEATKLHASGSAGATSGGPYSTLVVQLTCDRGVVCRWNVAPAVGSNGARISLVGSLGKVTLSMTDDSAPWRLETRRGGQSKTAEYPRWDPAATALARLVAAARGEPAEPSWPEAARTVELADTVDRSLARGRTIDLHKEDFTDLGTFKGTMASAGCALLMAGLGLVLCVGLLGSIAAQAGWNNLAEILGKWPYLLVAVLGTYLLLQLFLLIGKPKEPTDRQRRPGDSS